MPGDTIVRHVLGDLVDVPLVQGFPHFLLTGGEVGPIVRPCLARLPSVGAEAAESENESVG